MNRRDRNRIDERKRDSCSSHFDTGNEKGHMNSYAESQKLIQSLSTLSGAPESDTAIAKSFRIPRKQPQQERKMANQQPASMSASIMKSDTSHGKPIVKRTPTEQYPFMDEYICENRKTFYKPIYLVLFDRQHSELEISPKNVPLLLEAINNMLVNELTLEVKLGPPRFLGYRYDCGMLYIVCNNRSSRSFLEDQIHKIVPPWPGAQLDCMHEPYRECICTVVMPKSISHFSEFVDLCQKAYSSLCTEKWQCISHEECENRSGLLVHLGMDLESYEFIIENHGFLHVANTDVNFVLSTKSLEFKKS